MMIAEKGPSGSSSFRSRVSLRDSAYLVYNGMGVHIKGEVLTCFRDIPALSNEDTSI
jgi:hypothetical protein